MSRPRSRNRVLERYRLTITRSSPEPEIYAYLITHQAVLMTHVASSAGLDPDRHSFTTALRLACRYVLNQAKATGPP